MPWIGNASSQPLALPPSIKRLCIAALLAVFLCGSLGPAEAQTPSRQHQIVFNAGPQFATGDASDAYKTGLAIDVGYYYRATEAVFVGVYGGYQQFASDNGSGDLDLIPVNLTATYAFSLTGVQPYVGAEEGPFFLSNGERSTELGIAPRIGVRVPLSRGIDLDLTLKYNAVFTEGDSFTYVGTNGGFAYLLGRTGIEDR